MKRRFIPPLMFVFQIITLEEPMEPVLESKDIAKVLYAKDKCITDMEAVSTEVITPKEYGLKRMKTKRYKV